MKIDIRQASWPEDKIVLSSIRRQVFIEEQKVPEEMEWDEYDISSIHCIASVNGKAIGTGRLMNNGQIGRMGVLNKYRGKGIGTTVLKFLIEQHRSHSNTPILIHAQTHAIDFYKKFGFVINGDEFDEAGIPHVEMILEV